MENICEYCQKSFKSLYYCNTHISTCKKNPNKKITNSYTESDMIIKDKEIEMLKQQIEFLLSQKSIPIQKSSHKNEEPDKAVEPKYKTPIDKYIHIDCKEALNFDTLIKFAKDNFTLQDFKSIVLQKYEKKYISMLKKLLEKIPKKNMPIQIKTNKLNNEEGYIKIGDNFERYFRAELYDQFKLLIGGNGRNNLSNILQCLLSDYKDLDECEFTESESVFANMSIIGFEEFDNETGIDKFPKKLLTLNRNILDLFMVNL